LNTILKYSNVENVTELVISKKEGVIFFMKKWTLDYWDDESGKHSVERWLQKLTHEHFKAVFKKLKLLEKMGNDLKLPHSRPLGKGLFELREFNYGYRVYYGFYKDKLIILLHAGDKDTQQKDIKVARGRLAKMQ